MIEILIEKIIKKQRTNMYNIPKKQPGRPKKQFDLILDINQQKIDEFLINKS